MTGGLPAVMRRLRAVSSALRLAPALNPTDDTNTTVPTAGLLELAGQVDEVVAHMEGMISRAGHILTVIDQQELEPPA